MRALTCFLLLLVISVAYCQDEEEHDHDHDDQDEQDEACSTVAMVAVENGLDTLVAALTAADLTDVVGFEFNGTVFAPTEEAFVELLTNLDLSAAELLADFDLLRQVLLIHVILDVNALSTDLEDGQEIPTAAEGVSVTVSIDDEGIFIVAPSGVRAQVVTPDVVACDAVVHVIDAVLTPALPAVAEAPGPSTDEIDLDGLEDECSTVVETAVNSELSTLVAALEAADLVDVVGPEFAGTVFAPTEEAFVALLEDLELTAEELLADTDLLTEVLLIHVIPDVAALSTDLTDGQEIPTAAEGVSVTVAIEGDAVFIVAPSGDRAQVVIADVAACDAIVHVIDAVLTPAP